MILVLRVFHGGACGLALGFLDGRRGVIIGLDELRYLFGKLLGWRAGAAGEALVVLAQRRIFAIGGGVCAQVLIEGNFELGLFQTGITGVAQRSAMERKCLRQGDSRDDATYSVSLEDSANSVRSDFLSFCRYGKPDDMAETGFWTQV